MTYLNEHDPGAGAVAEEVTGVAAVEHAEPKSGGSYVRDLNTGALIQTAGPALDDQPSKE